VHLVVGFIIRIYHDARSQEGQILVTYLLMFILFHNKLQDEIFGSNSSKNSAIVFSFKFLRDAILILSFPEIEDVSYLKTDY
jgi:hypothetical protein